MNKKLIVLVSVLVSVLSVTLDGKAAPTEEPKMGGTLIFGLGKEFANPNPYIATSSTFQFPSFQHSHAADCAGKFVEDRPNEIGEECLCPRHRALYL